jgi:hypothetical protein
LLAKEKPINGQFLDQIAQLGGQALVSIRRRRLAKPRSHSFPNHYLQAHKFGQMLLAELQFFSSIEPEKMNALTNNTAGDDDLDHFEMALFGTERQQQGANTTNGKGIIHPFIHPSM